MSESLWASYPDALKLILTGSTTKTLAPAQKTIFINMLAARLDNHSEEIQEGKELSNVRTQKHYKDEARQEYEFFYYIPDLFRYMLESFKEWNIYAPPVDLDYLNSLTDELGKPLFTYSDTPGQKAWEESLEGQQYWTLLCSEIDIKQELEELGRTHHGGDPLKLEAQKRMKNELKNRLTKIKVELNSFDSFISNSQPSAVEIGTPAWREQNARNAANAKHDQPGGSRDKQQQIRNIWATGKYSTRDLCAEEECGALGMSFSAARKALRNSPQP